MDKNEKQIDPELQNQIDHYSKIARFKKIDRSKGKRGTFEVWIENDGIASPSIGLIYLKKLTPKPVWCFEMYDPYGGLASTLFCFEVTMFGVNMAIARKLMDEYGLEKGGRGKVEYIHWKNEKEIKNWKKKLTRKVKAK